MNPHEQNAQQYVNNNGAPFLQYKRNRIFKENEIDNNEKDNAPCVIEQSGKKLIRIFSNGGDHAEKEITQPEPQIEFGLLYIN